MKHRKNIIQLWKISHKLKNISNTPPQVGIWRSWMPNLQGRKCKRFKPKALVNMSVSYSALEMWHVEMCPYLRWSWMKWQLILMCSVCSWKTRLAAIWRPALSSQVICIGWRWSMSSEWSNHQRQSNSTVMVAMEWYSTSMEDWPTMLYFFVF